MGEIADLILEGQLCQYCGVCMDNADGFAQTCAGCGRADKPVKKKVSASRKCGAVRCREQIARHYAFCQAHWALVDQETQGQIYATFKNKDRTEYHGHIARAVRSIKNREENPCQKSP